MESAGKSDLGQIRKNNEDCYFVGQEIGLFLVADGMGGHRSGEVASRLACDIISNNLKHKSIDSKAKTMYGEANTSLSEDSNNLLSAIRLANRMIYEAGANTVQNRGMGTTIVAVLVREKSYTIAWVGDSRIYLVRHGRLQQLTTDHSLVQEQMNKGLISSEQAETSEFKNVLTRAMGTSEEVEVDIAETNSFDGDYLLLCSDGLTRMVPDQLILETINKYQQPQNICDELINLANKAGGRDNITAIVINNKEESFLKKFIKSVANLS
jgi:PPM family protein phosphatase